MISPVRLIEDRLYGVLPHQQPLHMMQALPCDQTLAFGSLLNASSELNYMYDHEPKGRTMTTLIGKSRGACACISLSQKTCTHSRARQSTHAQNGDAEQHDG